jgi:hypothetical protein
VVARAQEQLVGELAAAALGPMGQVMGRAPGRGALAARPPAVLVARVERPPGRPGHDPLAAANVDHHRIGAEQDSRQGAVAGHALDRLGRDRHRLQQPGRGAGQAAQGLQGGGDLDVGAAGAVLAELDQGIGPALVGQPVVVLALPARQRPQRGLERGPGGGIENALQVDQAQVAG